MAVRYCRRGLTDRQAPDEPGPGYWILSKYEDIKWVSKNHRLFASTPSVVIQDPIREELELAPPSMIGMDPPAHARYRKLVSGGFTPREIATQEPAHRAIVDAILDRVATPYVLLNLILYSLRYEWPAPGDLPAPLIAVIYALIALGVPGGTAYLLSRRRPDLS